MLRQFVFLATILVIRGQSTAVNKCTYFPGALPSQVYIQGCVTPPCRLPQNQHAVLNMVFTAPHDITRMNTLATAFVGIIPVPVPFPMGHLSAACDLLLDISCPVAKGHTINYELNIFMEPSVMLLNTRANVEFRIVDQDNQPLICIDVPFHIVPANSTMLAEN